MLFIAIKQHIASYHEFLNHSVKTRAACLETIVGIKGLIQIEILCGNAQYTTHQQ